MIVNRMPKVIRAHMSTRISIKLLPLPLAGFRKAFPLRIILDLYDDVVAQSRQAHPTAMATDLELF